MGTGDIDPNGQETFEKLFIMIMDLLEAYTERPFDSYSIIAERREKVVNHPLFTRLVEDTCRETHHATLVEVTEILLQICVILSDEIGFNYSTQEANYSNLDERLIRIEEKLGLDSPEPF